MKKLGVVLGVLCNEGMKHSRSSLFDKGAGGYGYLAAMCAIFIMAGCGLGLSGIGEQYSPWVFTTILPIILISMLRWSWQGAVVCILLMMSWLHMSHAIDHVLPLGLNRQNVQLTGTIKRLDIKDTYALLTLSIDACTPIDPRLPRCSHVKNIQLGWKNPPSLKRGDTWTLIARLQIPHQRSNPGQLLEINSSLRNAISATGKVRSIPPPTLIKAAGFSTREWLAQRISDALKPQSSERWARGLLLGEGDVFTDADWALLNDTGTVHLVVVSGMHVGMVVLTSVLIISRLLKFISPRHWRVHQWHWFIALALGFLYVKLSGEGPAAERAWIMVVAVAWAASAHYPFSVFTPFWMALGIIGLLDPLVILRPGFWLSFIAVSILLIGWRWRKRRKGLLALLHTQMTLGLVMDGLVMLLFGRWAPAALIANLFAIPWVTTIMLPLAILAMFVEILTNGRCSFPLWWCFQQAVALFEYALSRSAHWLPSVPLSSWDRLGFGLGMVLVGLVWTFPGFSVLYRISLSLALCLLLFCSREEPIRKGGFMLRVHDVGQGQLIDIMTAKHRMLYDTGPRFFNGTMPIESLWTVPQVFDMVMVSHGDLDHSGGIPVLRKQHKVKEWRAPREESLNGVAGMLHPVRTGQKIVKKEIVLPRQHDETFIPCRAGQTWQWDGVVFTVLWPKPGLMETMSENQRSCVLMVKTATFSVLILGDADSWVERQLLKELSDPVFVMVSGHHGSHTSSSRALLVRTRPRHVIHSAGFMNSYKHPSDKVVQRVHEFTHCQWNTAIDGAVTLEISHDFAEISPQRTSAGISRECLAVSSSASSND